jgi:streptogrisin D
VTVTSAADAAQVRAAGAVPKMVARSAADLARTTSTLRRSVRTPGTGWAVDPATNKVVVWVDSTITGTRMAALRRTLAAQGGATRVERVPGRIRPLIAGGDAIFAGRGRCSLGFNVRNAAGARFFLTAGHCGNIAARWTLRDGTALGTRVSSSFPRNDFALIRYTNASIAKPGAVTLFGGLRRDITASGNAVVGRPVVRSGSTTGVHTGVVTALNSTVNYPEGTVTGLIRTTVCAEPGDSGGPLFAGNTALGLTSGGSGDCRTGGVTFFQPVVEALGTLKVRIY